MHTPITIPFPGMPTASSRPSRRGSSPLFWTFQLVVWPAYGVALMLPWLGTYTIASMMPNKLVVAGTGLAISAGLRSAYLSALRRWPSPGTVIAVVITASLVAGLLWDGLLSALLGGAASPDLRRLGALGSRIPQFAGAFYHTLVLLTWSMSYLGLKQYWTRPVEADEAPPLHAPRRLIFRDGKRAVMLDAGDINRLEAAGDYVRIHTGSRRLLLRATLSGIEATLPEADFVRIHRSSIVPIAKVRELVPLANSEYDVMLRDGTKLRASRTYAGRLRAALGIGPG